MLKTETLNLRVSVEFKRKLVEEAKRENRSVTNYIEATITEVWARRVSSTNLTKSKKGE
jgi:predicted HicB family RNase H-like nuclease